MPDLLRNGKRPLAKPEASAAPTAEELYPVHGGTPEQWLAYFAAAEKEKAMVRCAWCFQVPHMSRSVHGTLADLLSCYRIPPAPRVKLPRRPNPLGNQELNPSNLRIILIPHGSAFAHPPRTEHGSWNPTPTMKMTRTGSRRKYAEARIANAISLRTSTPNTPG